MPRYDYRCTLCGRDEEISCPVSETLLPRRCTSGSCDGIMEIRITSAPYLHPSAVPTRTGDGVSFRTGQRGGKE